MSAIVPFRFAVESHPFTVIEVDGVNHQPLTATSLSISAGQRYSVVLHANQQIANYWIAYPSKFLGDTTTITNPNYNGTEAYAILSYQGAPDGWEPTTPQLIAENGAMEGGSGALQEYQLKVCNILQSLSAKFMSYESRWWIPLHLVETGPTLSLSLTSLRPGPEAAPPLASATNGW